MTPEIVIYTGINGFPERAFLTVDAMLDDLARKYPSATIETESGDKGRHQIKVSGVVQDGPMGKWTKRMTFGFTVLPVEGAQ